MNRTHKLLTLSAVALMKATALVVGGRWWNNSNSMDGALASLRVTEGALTTNEFLNASAKWPSGSVATSTTMLIR